MPLLGGKARWAVKATVYTGYAMLCRAGLAGFQKYSQGDYKQMHHFHSIL